MQEKEINEDITVQKIDKHGIFNPSLVPMLADNKFAEAIFAGLAEMLEHSNPSLLEQVIG
ncbi:hypothetical protein IAI15_36595, partial [Escherichia coli]|nr:hypothetical protein [Escherichia coli]